MKVAGASIIAVGILSVPAVAQLVYPTPGPGSGVVTVAGSVNVANTPAVSAVQSGEWKVAVTNSPVLQMPPPEFLRVKGRYEIAWPGGQRETVTVVQLGSGAWGSWARVQAGSDRVRWINIATAWSVEEVP